jgi:RHS repeat-associated protein
MCPSGTSALSDAYRYDGWGRQVAKSGASTNPFRYRGLLNLGSDDLAGALLAMGAREYSSQLGTFTQEDSVQGGAANPATMNRFLYALANPATLIDPDGHQACLDEGTTCTTTATLRKFVSTSLVKASHRRSRGRVTPHGAAPVTDAHEADDDQSSIPNASGSPDDRNELWDEWNDDEAAYKQQQQDQVDAAWDIAGFAGPVGPVADLTHAGSYLTRGDFGNAVVSLLGAVPLFGDALAGVAKGPKIVAATSKLAEAAKFAELAAKSGKITIKDYHLVTGLKKGASVFLGHIDAEGAVLEALKSPAAIFMKNTRGRSGFIMITDLGREIGTNGQTAVKIVFNEAGEIITSFPYWPLK